MKIQTVSPDFLLWHSLIQSLPRWSDGSQEMTDLVEDIRERGIDQPLVVCVSDHGAATPAYHYLIDGRHRHRAAILAGLTEVPVIVREESEAPGVVLGSLCQRRHFTKGALAYLSYPVLAAMHANNGGNRGNQHKKLPASIQSTLASAEVLALQLGFGRDLFFQARSLHETFDKRPDLREELEPRIVAGEIGLGACIAGIAGKEATDGKSRNDRPPEQLIFATFNDFRTRFTRWDQIDAGARKAVCNAAADTMLNLPEEVQESILKALRAARK